MICVGAGLVWAARITDDLALYSQRAQVERSVALFRERVQQTLTMEIAWDEVVESVKADGDEQQSVISRWLDAELGIEYALVFDEHDQVRYYGSRGRRLDPAGALRFGHDLERLLAGIRARDFVRSRRREAEPSGGDVSIAVLRTDRLDHTPILVFATSIPESAEHFQRSAPGPVLIALKKPDLNLVRELAGGLLLDDARILTSGEAVDGHAMVPITDFEGQPIAYVSWLPAHPGQELLARALPFVAIGAACLLALGSFATARIWHAQRLLEHGEARAVRQAEQLERMSRIAQIGAWDYDASTGTLSMSDESYRIYGLIPGTAVGLRTILDLYSSDDRKRIRDVMQGALDSGDSWELECNARTVDGRSIWVRGLGETERRNGRVVRLFGTLQDTTRARHSANELADAMEALRIRNDELQQFTRAASHDLQEPVRKVQALGSLLLARVGDEVDSRTRDFIGRMRSAAARMAQLVDDLLAYSRVTAGAVRQQPVALDKVVSEVVDDLDELIRRNDGSVQVAPLPEISGDPTQIRQVMQNLIGNALKYRHPDRQPTVQVSASIIHVAPANGPICRIEVSDNGIGFDSREAEAIFRPFRRLHDRSTYDGSGIGLSLVRRIVDGHGGRVWAEGRPGAGASFIVELPVAKPAPVAQEAAAD
jgi:signal transduction histidine kinase